MLFALMHLLGFRFAPRIRDLKDTKLYIPKNEQDYAGLQTMIGLNLVTATIVLWNTVYLEKAIRAQRSMGKNIDDTLLQYLFPLGWEHINLTGDYVWRQNRKNEDEQFWPLRTTEKS